MTDQLYSFVYEFGKLTPSERVIFACKVKDFLALYLNTDLDDLKKVYPAITLGEEARDAKNKVDDLKPKKPVKKTKKTQGKK